MKQDINNITFSCSKIKATNKQLELIDNLLDDIDGFEEQDYITNIAINKNKYTKQEASSVINDLKARREFHHYGGAEEWYWYDDERNHN